MAFTHGSKAVILVDDQSGTPTDISAYVTKASFPVSSDTVEVTTLGKQSKQRIPGLKDASCSLEGVWDATVDALMTSILGATGTVEYRPEGTGTGKRKYTGEFILTSYEPDASVDGAVGWKAEFSLGTGDVTAGVQ